MKRLVEQFVKVKYNVSIPTSRSLQDMRVCRMDNYVHPKYE